MARDDAAGQLVVRVRSKPGSHAVSVRNRIGRSSWSSGVAVLGANGRLGPPSVRYVLDGTPLSSDDATPVPPDGASPFAHRFRARTLRGYCGRTLHIELPLDLGLPLPQLWQAGDTIGFEQWRTCCIPSSTAPGTGCTPFVYQARFDPALPWRVEILATDGSRIAGAFSGTLLEDSTALVVTEGTFVVDIEP